MKLVFKIASALLTTTALSTFGISSQAQTNLLPAKVGNYWVLNGNAGKAPLSMTYKVMSVKSANGVTTAVFTMFKDSAPVSSETYLIDSKGVSRSLSGATGKDVITPPVQIIRYPVKIGETWNWKGTINTAAAGKLDCDATLKVARQEQVVTKAGKFNAVKIDMKLTVHVSRQTQTIDNSYWFAPGVGMVKQVALLPDGKGGEVELKAVADEIKVK